MYVLCCDLPLSSGRCEVQPVRSSACWCGPSLSASPPVIQVTQLYHQKLEHLQWTPVLLFFLFLFFFFYIFSPPLTPEHSTSLMLESYYIPFFCGFFLQSLWLLLPSITTPFSAFQIIAAVWPSGLGVGSDAAFNSRSYWVKREQVYTAAAWFTYVSLCAMAQGMFYVAEDFILRTLCKFRNSIWNYMVQPQIKWIVLKNFVGMLIFAPPTVAARLDQFDPAVTKPKFGFLTKKTR